MAQKGKFIVFEGIDGSGKTTQIKALNEYLQQKGISTYLTQEPTKSEFGVLLRSCLGGKTETNEKTIAALFAADRLDHILNAQNGILSKLEQGITVLCDRYYFSSLAYNGEFVSVDWVHALNSEAQRTLKADLTVFIDVSPEECMRRVSSRKEKERYETLEKQKKIRARYLEVFEKFGEGEHIKRVESKQNPNQTQEEIRKLIDGLFGV